MSQAASTDTMDEYVSTLKFSLNFEDHKNSAMVKKGDTILYNGQTSSSFIGRTLPHSWSQVQAFARFARAGLESKCLENGGWS